MAPTCGSALAELRSTGPPLITTRATGSPAAAASAATAAIPATSTTALASPSPIHARTALPPSAPSSQKTEPPAAATVALTPAHGEMSSGATPKKLPCMLVLARALRPTTATRGACPTCRAARDAPNRSGSVGPPSAAGPFLSSTSDWSAASRASRRWAAVSTTSGPRTSAASPSRATSGLPSSGAIRSRFMYEPQSKSIPAPITAATVSSTPEV
eukprot:scaffold18809_cov102-Isochrysis_galbana.AAC.3